MQLEVSERIHFLEFTPEVERLMAVADLLLLPSEMESFGLVALEAMACGVPVVASRVGGIPEVVLDGQTGRLCTPGDIKGMAEAALEILSNPYLHHQMGEAGHERAITVFSPEKVLPKYVELYRQTCV
jgi:glycosyltransferase involved in cell wall biosynthesis